ncbi:MAG: peptidase M61, partial [Gammaproteobacteria bacterium]|nr:peptidase M61 [Gammaproteobacteria bacterium]
MSKKVEVHYSITPSNPNAHLFAITCTIDNPHREGEILSMPAWIPGSYMIRDFAKNIVQISAATEDGELKLNKLDKQTWQCEATNKTITVKYEVYAWDLSVRTAHLDSTHGFFNSSSVFLAVKSKQHQSCTVEINPPAGSQFKDWRVATTLPCKSASLYEFGIYEASDYDELIDHPV